MSNQALAPSAPARSSGPDAPPAGTRQPAGAVAPQLAGCCAPLASQPLDGPQATEVAKAFKALGDPVRVRLLSHIASAPGETCVCDLTGGFDVSGPTISHHLKILREAGLVDCERRGTWVYYWARPERLAWMSTLLASPGLSAAPASEGANHGR